MRNSLHENNGTTGYNWFTPTQKNITMEQDILLMNQLKIHSNRYYQTINLER